MNQQRLVIFPWFVCSLAAIFYCYEFFLRISPSVMAQELMRVYHLTSEQLGDLSAFYYHAYVPMQIVVGLLMDKYGPRRLLTLACLCCAFGTILFAGGHSLFLAHLGRFLVGFGSAFAFVGALKLVTIWLSIARFALFAGIITTLGMAGAMMGDIFLHLLTTRMGFYLTNVIAAIVGVFLTILIWLTIRDKNPEAATQLVVPLTFKELFKEFLLAIKNPALWLNGLVGCMLYMSLSVFAELWGISYLESAHGLAPGTAAAANSMIFLGWAIGGPLWGWFSDYIQRRVLPLGIGTIGVFVLFCCLLYLPLPSTTLIYSLLFLIGFFAGAEILIFSLAHELTNIKIVGTAIAITNMIVMLAGNFLQPIVGMLLDKYWTGTIENGVRVYSNFSYQVALSILPIGTLLAVVLIFFMRETYCKVHK